MPNDRRPTCHSERAVEKPRAKGPNASNSLRPAIVRQSVRLFARRFSLSAHYAKPDILRRSRAICLRVRLTISAAADCFALAAACQNPFGHIAAEVEHQLFVVFALASKCSDGLQQRSARAQIAELFPQQRGIFRIRRVPGP